MIFIDCGFHIGNMLKIYLENGLVDDSWDIYLFDPNPEVRIEDIVKQFPVKAKTYNKAVWTSKGKIDFAVSERHNASHVEGTTRHDNDQITAVPAIDFSKFLAELPDEYTICSMDIEGSEYPVLEKLIEERTIDKIDLLDIEFHHRFMSHKETQDSVDLTQQLLNRGVAVKLRIPFE